MCVKVVNRINGKNVWFTVSGSCLSRGPTSTSLVQLSTTRTGYLGHGYRIVASTTIQYPNGGGAVNRSATVYSGDR